VITIVQQRTPTDGVWEGRAANEGDPRVIEVRHKIEPTVPRGSPALWNLGIQRNAERRNVSYKEAKGEIIISNLRTKGVPGIGTISEGLGMVCDSIQSKPPQTEG
jgi:hypothetical protein